MDPLILKEVKKTYAISYQKYRSILAGLSDNELIFRRLAAHDAFIRAMDYGMDSERAAEMVAHAEEDFTPSS